MKKNYIFTFILLSIFFIVSCVGKTITEECDLRQLNIEKQTNTNSSGMMFFTIGSYKSETLTTNIVNMCIKYKNQYRFIKVPIYQLRIILDSTKDIPTIQQSYQNDTFQTPFEEFFPGNEYILRIKEEYLPINLIPLIQ